MKAPALGYGAALAALTLIPVAIRLGTAGVLDAPRQSLVLASAERKTRLAELAAASALAGVSAVVDAGDAYPYPDPAPGLALCSFALNASQDALAVFRVANTTTGGSPQETVLSCYRSGGAVVASAGPRNATELSGWLGIAGELAASETAVYPFVLGPAGSQSDGTLLAPADAAAWLPGAFAGELESGAAALFVRRTDRAAWLVLHSVAAASGGLPPGAGAAWVEGDGGGVLAWLPFCGNPCGPGAELLAALATTSPSAFEVRGASVYSMRVDTPNRTHALVSFAATGGGWVSAASRLVVFAAEPHGDTGVARAFGLWASALGDTANAVIWVVLGVVGCVVAAAPLWVVSRGVERVAERAWLLGAEVEGSGWDWLLEKEGAAYSPTSPFAEVRLLESAFSRLLSYAKHIVSAVPEAVRRSSKQREADTDLDSASSSNGSPSSTTDQSLASPRASPPTNKACNPADVDTSKELLEAVLGFITGPEGRGRGGGPKKPRMLTRGPAMGVRLKKASVLLVEVDVLSSNTDIVDEHINLSNIALDSVTNVLRLNDGVPITVLANSVLAAWNAHDKHNDHPVAACRAANGIRAALQAYINNAAMWALAVASGNTFAGFHGTTEHKVPVVSGETVSLANDMIRLAERVRCRVLVSEGTMEQTQDSFKFRPVDAIRVLSDPLAHEGEAGAGSDEEVVTRCIYELLGGDDPAAGYDLRAYTAGFVAFRSQDYATAMGSLRDFLARHPDDYQGFRLARLAQLFSANGPRHPPPPFPSTREDHGWDNLEYEASLLPLPLGVEAVHPPANAGGARDPAAAAGASAAKDAHKDKSTIGNMLNAMARRAAEDKAEEANRLKKDIQRAREAKTQEKRPTLSAVAAAPAGSSDQVFTDRKGMTWSKSALILGVGAFGEVYRGMSVDGGLVAMKILKLPYQAANPSASRYANRRRQQAGNSQNAEQATQELINEVDMLTKLRHENVVAYLASIVVGQSIVICMELMPIGSLATLVGLYESLPLSCVVRYLRDILRGLKFLHENDIIHRDIKPHNVLVAVDGQAKLSDFGSSGQQLAKLKEKSAIQGTPLYMAPEAARGYSVRASDVWGVGVTLAELLTGSTPYVFTEEQPFSVHNFVYRLGTDDTFGPVIPDELPKNMKEIIEMCLTREPDKRPTVEDLLKSPLSHLPAAFEKAPMLSRVGSTTSLRSDSRQTVRRVHDADGADGDKADVQRRENSHLLSVSATLRGTGPRASRCDPRTLTTVLRLPGVGTSAAMFGMFVSNSGGEDDILNQLISEDVPPELKYANWEHEAVITVAARVARKPMSSRGPRSAADYAQDAVSGSLLYFGETRRITCAWFGQTVRAVLCREGRSFPLTSVSEALPSLASSSSPELDALPNHIWGKKRPSTAPRTHAGIDPSGKATVDLCTGDSFIVMAPAAVFDKLGTASILDALRNAEGSAMEACLTSLVDRGRPSSGETTAIIVVALRSSFWAHPVHGPRIHTAPLAATDAAPLRAAWKAFDPHLKTSKLEDEA
ncbi:Mitogen-activated protein kinase kinase kinase ANP1 [Diplonema papillatum]|nr:Mitogen-activated protein kinase kinase kinase ANP1 [Diplonema papillatum]